MTETKKRGRGRPRKIDSFQQLKQEMDEALDTVHPTQQGFDVVADIKKSLNWAAPNEEYVDTSKPPIKFTPVRAFREVSFPKDWATMGKIDRLAWLTENRRK